VIIRNETNGKVCDWALFRRERDLPGTHEALQMIPADACARLVILLVPDLAPLNVTALRDKRPDSPAPEAAPEGH